MRSICAVSHPVIRVVPRVLRSPDHTTTNALNSSSAGNVLSNNPEGTWLGTTLPRNRLLSVSRHVVFVLTFVSGLDHCNVLTLGFHSCHMQRFQFHCVLHSQYLAHCTLQLNPLTCIALRIHTNIKRVLPAFVKLKIEMKLQLKNEKIKKKKIKIKNQKPARKNYITFMKN